MPDHTTSLRILADILPLQTRSSKRRGIGVYTGLVLRALLEQLAEGQAYILLANGHLPAPDPLPPDTPTPWRLYYGDFPLGDYRLDQGPQKTADYHAYWQAQIERFAPDVLHIHSPFEFEAPPHSRYEHAPTVLTVYDLIPLRLEAQYLRPAPEWMKEDYHHICGLIRQADHIITLSNHSRDDIVELLGVESDRVSVAPPGPSSFCRLAPTQRELAELREKYALSGGFVLCVSGSDRRKNLTGTLDAYSRLHPRIRREFPLVIVCALMPREEETLWLKARELSIGDQVIFTNYIPDEELAALYRLATVQIFPSFYEGFGMPVLDAMACGLPVITSNVTSLPEVAGDAALLVNPSDPAEMADALARGLESEQLRDELRAKGLAQAAQFTWERAARVFRQAYRNVGASRGQAFASPFFLRQPARLCSLALVSPFPPQRSGIADYSASLFQALREHLLVTAFVPPDQLAAIREHVRGPIESVARLPHMVQAGQVDAILYQMGNSPFHHFELPYLLTMPGVVEVHDGVLHGMIHTLTLAQGDVEGYRHELSYAHDQAGREKADAVIAGQTDALAALYEMTANRRVVNSAVGVIVHNRWAAESLDAQRINLPVMISHLPMEHVESIQRSGRAAARAALGIPQDALVLATFGRLTFGKRLDVILHVFARLRQEITNVELFLVGELDAPSGDFNIPRTIAELGLASPVHVTGYIDSERFARYMTATDIGLNLRYPHAGESSATLLHLLSLGIPVITSHLGPFAELPDDCCWKVDVDDIEKDLLLAYLERLATHPALLQQMSANALRFAHANIPTWEGAARLYVEFIASALASQRPLLPSIWSPARDAKEALRSALPAANQR